jgi:hypothetical protein
MSWLDDLRLRDIDDEDVIEATCLACGHAWKQTAIQLLLKVDHRDVTLDEVAKHLACTRYKCRSSGARLKLLRKRPSSGFVAGMP